MRRFMSTILTAVAFIALSVVPAFAADPAIEVSTAEASPGDSVTLTFTLSDNPGIAAYQADLVYDQSALQLTGASSGKDLRALTFIKYIPNNRVAAFAARNATKNGAMFTATFRVLDGAAEGLAPVTLSVTEMVSADYVYYTPTITSGGVTVVPGGAAGTAPPANTEEPAASDAPIDPDNPDAPPGDDESGNLEELLGEDFFAGDGVDINVEDVLAALGIEKDTSVPTITDNGAGDVLTGAADVGELEQPPMEVELSPENTSGSTSSASGVSPMVWIVLAAAVVCAAGGAYIIINRKKRSASEKEE